MPDQNIRTENKVCSLSFLLVTWVVVNDAPADLLSEPTGAPQFGQVTALSDI